MDANKMSIRIVTIVIILLTGILVANAGSLYVAAGGSGGQNVYVIDSGNYELITTINIGAGVQEIVVNPTGTRAYCTHLGDRFADPPDPGYVSVINTVTNEVISTVNVGRLATEIAINPSGTKAYIAYHSSSADWLDLDVIAVFDTTTNQVTDTITVGNDIADILISPDGSTIYVSNIYPSSTDPDDIIVMNVANHQIEAVIPGFPAPLQMAIKPDGSRLYVANEDGPVSVINTATNTVVDTIDCGDELDSMAISPDGDTLYAPHFWEGYYSVIATDTNSVAQTVNYSTTLWAAVRGVAVNSEGTYLYIGSMDYDEATYIDSPTLFVFSTDTNQLIATIPVDNGITGITVSEEVAANEISVMPWIPLLLLNE